jgi:hypothetical protein
MKCLKDIKWVTLHVLGGVCEWCYVCTLLCCALQ